MPYRGMSLACMGEQKVNSILGRFRAPLAAVLSFRPPQLIKLSFASFTVCSPSWHDPCLCLIGMSLACLNSWHGSCYVRYARFPPEFESAEVRYFQPCILCIPAMHHCVWNESAPPWFNLHIGTARGFEPVGSGREKSLDWCLT